jgi:GAF domain-containing protein
MTDPIATALAQGQGQPAAALDALGRLAQEVTGATLVTLMTSDPTTREAERIWSNMPEAYPVSGRKPMNPTHWSRTVIDRKETFVANTIQEIAEVFPDHPLILSLGCESVMNLPAVVGGEVLGTLNCLGGRNHFTPERLRQAEALRLPTAAVFLAHLCLTNGTIR